MREKSLSFSPPPRQTKSMSTISKPGDGGSDSGDSFRPTMQTEVHREEKPKRQKNTKEG
jgi:hypothetical protein